MPFERSLALTDESRIAGLCAAKWLKGNDVQKGIPGSWYIKLHCGHAWDNKKRGEYEKACRRTGRGSQARREDPLNPAWVHRLSFIYSADETLEIDGANLARLVRGETRADFNDEDDATHSKREAYDNHLKRLKGRWERVESALGAGRLPGESEVRAVVLSLLASLSRRFLAMQRDFP